MGIKCVADFSDVDAYFTDGRRKVEQIMSEVGESAVDYAVQHGDYRDCSGNLRRSNKFKVEDDTLTLYNDARSATGELYAAKIEAKGHDVLSGAALFAEKELKEKFER